MEPRATLQAHYDTLEALACVGEHRQADDTSSRDPFFTGARTCSIWCRRGAGAAFRAINLR